MAYKIVADVIGDNPGRGRESEDDEQGENTGGVVLYIVSEDDAGYRTRWQEVTRVAYVREVSRHPDVPFSDQLDAEITKANAAVKAVNDMLNPDGELQ